MLRTLLLHSGFTAAEAMTFSCHSWRHLFPTAGRQLRLSNETLNDRAIGHRILVCLRGTTRQRVYLSSQGRQQFDELSNVVGQW